MVANGHCMHTHLCVCREPGVDLEFFWKREERERKREREGEREGGRERKRERERERENQCSTLMPSFNLNYYP